MALLEIRLSKRSQILGRLKEPRFPIFFLSCLIAEERKYFDWLAEDLGIERQEQFYQLTGSLRCDQNLLNSFYGGSIQKALQTNYSEFTWFLPIFHHKEEDYFKSHRLFC